MPQYEYVCTDHGIFDDFASVSDYRKPAPCPECESLCPRIISRLQRPIIHENGGPRERARKIRDRGLIELGTESPDTVRKYFESERAMAEAKHESELMAAAEEVYNDIGSDVADAIVREEMSIEG